MREHEHRAVVHRLLAPPAPPAFIGPGAAHRPEHVASENPRADVGHGFLGHGVVDAGFTALGPGDIGTEYLGGEEPRHHFREVDSEREVEALVGAGAIAIEGNSESRYA